jgi:hypothetical protein
MVTVTQNGKYNNIQLNSFKGTPGMAIGDTVTMVKGKFATSKFLEKAKTGADGKAYIMKMWMCNAIYQGQEVSFFLWNEEEAQAFDAAGEIGDEFHVTMTEHIVVNKKGQKLLKERLVFEKAA